ncbi:MAG: ParB/RepB/Spo0J family partition protein [Acidimicrobiales bacterium]
MREVPISQIRPNKFQPRKKFDEDTLGSLVDSIKAVGILQPVLVREVGEGEYELIAGERRLRAARRAGLATVPSLIRGADDVTSLEQALVENVHREDLNALDEAGAYQQLIEDFGLTHEEVARRVGKSRTAVTNALRLFQLPPSVQLLVRDARLSAGHARAILGTPDRNLQEGLASQAVRESLSVRTLEELVRQHEAARDEGEDTEEGEETEAAYRRGDRLSPLEPLDDAVASNPNATAPAPELALVPQPSGAGNEPPQAETPATALRPPGVADLEELLGDHLNTRVRVDMGGKHGRVVIDFATLDDLERIYRVIIGAGVALAGSEEQSY